MKRLQQIAKVNVLLTMLACSGCESDQVRVAHQHREHFHSISGKVIGANKCQVPYRLSTNLENGAPRVGYYDLTYLHIMDYSGSLHTFLYVPAGRTPCGRIIVEYLPLQSRKIEAKTLIERISDQMFTTDDTQVLSAEGLIMSNSVQYAAGQE